MRQDKRKKLSELFFRPRGKKKTSLRHQVAMVITVCCILAVSIQALMMLGIILKQFVSQQKEDTLYYLESDNTRMDDAIRYLGEMVLSIQHNAAVNSYLTSGAYSGETAEQELKVVANLFSQQNRIEGSRPLVEKIFLFKSTGESISTLYDPMTVSEMMADEVRYGGMNRRFLKQSRRFYFEVEEAHLNLCLTLYDEGMKDIGTCILALNRSGMESIYANVERLKGFGWSVSQGEEIILGRGDSSLMYRNALSHSMETGFGLTVKSAVPHWQVYKALGTTMIIIIFISILVVLLNSLIGYTVARIFVYPLETVAEKIKLVGKGNFDTKLGEYPSEELNDISEKFNEMTDYINVLVNQVYDTQLIAKQAQIQYLQAQMNPHFLFNVLSMIEMKAAINRDTEVQQMIYKLSRLYQGRIFRKNEQLIRLGEELEIVDFYLSLQNSRFGDKITYSIEYEGGKESYEDYLVPRLCIEPSVENAVCHGLEPKKGNGHIRVCIRLEKEDSLCITIEDDGVGFEPKLLEDMPADKKHSHVGICNTDRMVKNLCGEEYGVQIDSRPGEGTQVILLLPLIREEIQCGE